MIDARISVTLPTHPKTKKLIRRIGESGAFRMICLFLWAAANRSNGCLSGMTDEDIELAADWQGDEGALVAAMAEVGFLDGTEGSRSIHDWAEHNPWAAGADARSEKARWAALCRQHDRAGAAKIMPEYAKSIGVDVQGSASSMPVAVPLAASSNQQAESSTAPLPSPSPSPYPEDQHQKTTPSAPLTDAPDGAKPRKRESLPDPPDWIDPEAWAGFVDMRRRERHPLTARAASLIIGKLDRMRASGTDPTEALDQSTRNGWRDVFAPKPEGSRNEGSAGHRESASGRIARIAEEAERRDREGGERGRLV